MKLFHSANSPFVRQCLVAAHELGLAERIELVPAAAHPINRDRAVVEKNPLGKIPALITDDNRAQVMPLLDAFRTAEAALDAPHRALAAADGTGVNEHVFMLNPAKDDTWYDPAKVEEFMGVKPAQVADLLAYLKALK